MAANSGRDFSARRRGRRRGRRLGGVDLEELLGDLFGAGIGRGERRAGDFDGATGGDLEADLSLPLEDAYSGGRRTVRVDGQDYEVTIPAGVVSGQRIQLSGHQRRDRGTTGEVHVVVWIQPHPRFRLHDRDISVDLPVTPWEGVLGATVPVPTPVGETRAVLPSGSSTGRRLRLRGQGMPNPRGAPGDLYAVVRVVAPATVDDAQRALYQQLSRISTVIADEPRQG